jgi:uncharacterized protein YheU (UPF0270 family)
MNNCGCTKYRKDIVNYIIEKVIKNTFIDYGDIELDLTIENAKIVFKNQYKKGIYKEFILC